MTINELRDKAFNYADKQGFHENIIFGEKIMLIVTELSEAVEAHRNNKWSRKSKAFFPYPEDIRPDLYEYHFKGTVEEELADAILRIADIAGIYGVDLDFQIRAKMAYNETRPYKHGKRY